MPPLAQVVRPVHLAAPRVTGVKQRDVIVIDDAEIDSFLSRRRGWTIATLSPQGRVRLVGMWSVVDGHLWFETEPESRRSPPAR